MLSKIYQKGQVVIPAIVRHQYNLSIGDSVEICLEKGYLKLKKVTTKGLMDLAGIIKSDKVMPTKTDIKKSVEKAFIDRSKK